MKILVCGGRDFNNNELLYSTLTNIHTTTPITILVHGGCTGADKLASKWALEHHINTLEYPALWNTYGKAAGPIRNKLMLQDNTDISLVIAFEGGKGTMNMCKLAMEFNIEVKKVGN